MNCKICDNSILKIFDAKVLMKYQVNYFLCGNCGFMQTEKPYWLKEAYGNAITDLDLGLIFRNIYLSDTVETILLRGTFNAEGRFLDYGGGYGMFVRIMRDKGFQFYRQDIYCENLFAKHFDIMDLARGNSFELVTAFEVFEHIEDPQIKLDELLAYSSAVLISTEIIPENIRDINSWWYFAPETGQHISFFSIKALSLMADKRNLHFYTNGITLHLFSTKRLLINPFQKVEPTGLQKLLKRISAKLSSYEPKEFKRESLLMKDFEYVKRKISGN